MPLVRAISMPSITRAMALVVIASGGAGCPDTVGGDDTEGGTDLFEGTSFGTDNPDPTTTTTTTTSTTTSTTAPATESSTDPDSSSTDPSTSATETGGTGCASGGPFTIDLTGRTDPYGHFPYLLLFYPEDPPTSEVLDIVVGADGTITFGIAARDPGSGSGHSGIAGLTGTIDGACAVSIDGEVEYVSDTGPFGTIQVIVDGTFPGAGDGSIEGTMTLQGGNIPSGPITYTFQGQ